MSSFDTTPIPSSASIWPTAVKSGLIAGVVGILSVMLFYNMGLMEPGNTFGSIITTVITIAIGIVIVYFGLKSYRDGSNGGNLSLGKGLLWSLGYGVIAAVIGIAFSFVFFNFLAPDFIPNMMELQYAELEEQGMGEDEIEAAQSMMSIFMSPISFAIFGAFGQMFYAVVEGLVASLMLKTN
ncbi:MAG: DUF4199 domain-containing protein [Saprospiraceae bacterium]